MDENQKREADAFIKRLEYYRAEDRHECSLVNYRMSWLTTCQSFLIAAFVIVHNSQSIVLRLSLSILIPVVGIYVARKIKLSIQEADNIIDRWHQKEHDWLADVDRLTDVTLREYLRSFWGGRNWKGVDPQHEKSFEFQRKVHGRFESALWAMLFIGVFVDGYAAIRIVYPDELKLSDRIAQILDGLCGVQKRKAE